MVNISREITYFILDIMKNYPFDLMFAVQRKGMANIKSSEELHKYVGSKIFFLDATELARKEDIVGKKLLVYDDACMTGQNLMESVAKLKRKSAAIIKTAALTVCKDSDYKPDFFRFSLSGYDFNRFHSMIYDIHFGDELYDDHIFLKFRTKPGDLEKLLSYLHRMGPIIKTSEYRDVIAYSLLDIRSLCPDLGFQKVIEEEGVEKVRFFFHTDGKISIVPRIYPAIHARLIQKKDCKNFLRLCSYIGERSEIVCVKCMIFAINISVLSSLRPHLITAFKESGYSILSEEINDADLNASFFFGKDSIIKIKNELGMEN